MTTENNKIIAEFMGVDLPYKNDKGNWEYMVEGAGLINSPNLEVLDRFLGFNYDKDWNLLIDVVEKIINLKEVYAQGRQKVFNSISPNIETTYNACIEFIKWYNEQN